MMRAGLLRPVPDTSDNRGAPVSVLWSFSIQIREIADQHRLRTLIPCALFCLGVLSWVSPLTNLFRGSDESRTLVGVATAAATGLNLAERPDTSQQNDFRNIIPDAVIAEAAEPPDPFLVSSRSPVVADRSSAWGSRGLLISNAGRPEASRKTGLALQSTIIGRRHRAAIINDRLYREREIIRHRGHRYTLSAVMPGRIVLSGEAGSMELKILAPSETTPRSSTDSRHQEG